MTFALLCLAAFAPPLGGSDADDGFRYPLACTIAGDGTIYVADRRLPGVWRVTTTDGEPTRLSRFKTGGGTFRTPLNAPRCMVFAPPSKGFPSGAVLVGDSATRAIIRLDPTADEPAAEPLRVGETDVSPIGVPSALAVAADGTLFVADLESQRIYRVPPREPAAAIAALPGVRGLCLAADGALLAVTTEKDAIRRFVPAADGAWSEQVAVAGRPFQSPQGAALGPDGTLHVADNAAGCLWRLAPTGDGGFAEPTKLAAGAPLVGPTGVCFDSSTNPPRLIVVDPKARALFALNPAGGEVKTLAK
ncbi:NHL repeat-containing protein [Alienimonas californiensis]|uniref:Virginiamycin B lyase n=1 Tax=Alienimonas californiensis TaxID=2527989 RepID=A0A517P408_9PLAN|nr:hypothetical protein [Alienimonas californiensis]QDT14122.1 Virginiamycin B lyase [Alienimonas californiensis]